MTWLSIDKIITLFLESGFSPLGQENLLLYFFCYQIFSRTFFGVGLSSTTFALADKVLAFAATHLCLQ